MQARSAAAPPRARHLAAVVAGNALEFYDFVTYAFFATEIGRSFFPAATPSRSLLLSLATFGAGFVLRPLGAVVIGGFGDRAGRRPAMLLSFALMGLGIAGLALTPSYAAIGRAAPAAALFWRLLQGFALGGEVGPNTAYLIEAAPPGRRGRIAALQPASQDFAVLVAGAVGTALALLLSEAQLQLWGWRLALLLGAAIVPLGLVLRRALPETYAREPAAAAARPAWRPHLGTAATGLALLGAGTVANYTLDYLTTFARSTLGMRASVAFGATMALGFGAVCADLASGVLSDRFGRQPIIRLSWFALLLAVGPLFALVVVTRSAAALLGSAAIFGTLLNLGATATVVWLAESMPREVRSGMVATVYATAIAMFGGTTQFAVAWAIAATGSPYAPAVIMSVALCAGLAAAARARNGAAFSTAGRMV